MKLQSAIVVTLLFLSLASAADKFNFYKKHHQKSNDKKKNTVDVCEGLYCGPGRECQVNEKERPKCACKSSCPPHKKTICGSDGKKYQNHCELHRAACLQDKKISIVHNKECFYKNDDCSAVDYKSMKKVLLLHHKRKIGSEIIGPDFESSTSTPTQTPSASKKFVVSIMFNFYDENSNQRLSLDELDRVMKREKLSFISHTCTLLDFMHYDDKNGDKEINMDEFYTAFDISPVYLKEHLKKKTTLATVGESFTLVCGVTGKSSLKIVWERDGNELTDVPGLKIYKDGQLYFSSVTLLHAGTYTCYASHYEDVVQTHLVKVRDPPRVQVCPPQQVRPRRENGVVNCYAEGVPQPSVAWKRNGTDLVRTEDYHITLPRNHTRLRIQGLESSDGGHYKCSASNTIGVAEASSHIFVDDDNFYSFHRKQDPYDVFYIFHQGGIRVYDPATCQLKRNILPSEAISKTGKTICSHTTREKPDEHVCSWGEAVNVKKRFIYASQPLENRVIVIEADTQRVVQFISTEDVPVSLHYLEHLDEIWVVCWKSLDKAEGKRIIQVIRMASKLVPHHSIHTQPIDNRFDLVDDLFLPTSSQTAEKLFDFGYVVHKKESGLHKYDLEAMKSIGAVDLKSNCEPRSLVFVPIGGHVIVQCYDQSQVLLDYITDAVISHNGGVHGKPYISFDGRHIVSVDNLSGIVTVQSVTDEGKIETAYNQSVADRVGNVSDVSFYRSVYGLGVFLSSSEKRDVAFLLLKNGKLFMVKKFKAPPVDQWGRGLENRMVANSGLFGERLATITETHLSFFHGELLEAFCEIPDLKNITSIIWFGKC